jgi:hypothetical protein
MLSNVSTGRYDRLKHRDGKAFETDSSFANNLSHWLCYVHVILHMRSLSDVDSDRSWERCRRNWAWYNFRNYPVTCLQILKENMKISVRIVGVPDEIRTGTSRIQVRIFSTRANSLVHSLVWGTN